MSAGVVSSWACPPDYRDGPSIPLKVGAVGHPTRIISLFGSPFREIKARNKGPREADFLQSSTLLFSNLVHFRSYFVALTARATRDQLDNPYPRVSDRKVSQLSTRGFEKARKSIIHSLGRSRDSLPFMQRVRLMQLGTQAVHARKWRKKPK